MIRYMQRVDAAGRDPRVKEGGYTRRLQRTRGAPRNGKGRENCCSRSAAERVPPSSLILPCT